MKRFNRISIMLALYGVVACGAAPKGDVASDASGAQQDIVGGTTTQGFPAVGMFYNYAPGNPKQNIMCTASLIAPQTILTAAHCVMALNSQGVEQERVAQPQNALFYLGNDGADIDQALIHQVSQIYLPGGSNFPFQQFFANVQVGDYNDDDIAVIRLQDKPPVAPLSIAFSQPYDGEPLTFVGYGTTGQQKGGTTAGTKRTTASSISGFMGPYILQAGTASSGTCSGDSGGPALNANGQIVAITQAGEDANGQCVGNDRFTRADRWLPFIDSVIQ